MNDVNNSQSDSETSRAMTPERLKEMQCRWVCEKRLKPEEITAALDALEQAWTTQRADEHEIRKLSDERDAALRQHSVGLARIRDVTAERDEWKEDAAHWVRSAYGFVRERDALKTEVERLRAETIEQCVTAIRDAHVLTENARKAVFSVLLALKAKPGGAT